MRKYINKIRSYIIAHKIISVIIIIVIAGGGYWIYKKTTNTTGEIRYITAKIEKGTIITSVSGSGQVSNLNQIDIKAKASGDVSYIAIQDGQKVGAGQLIAQLDTKDAEKTIRDAEVNLESAQISLAKLKIEKSNENLNSDLAKAYDDGFNTVSNVFLDLPGIMTGLNDMFFKIYSGTSQWTVDWYAGQVGSVDQYKATTLKEDFIDSYNEAKKSYETNFDSYKTISRSSDNATIEALVIETYNTTKLISDIIKNANNYIDFVNDSIQKNNFDSPIIIATHKATLSTYTSKTNTHLVNLLGITTDIKNNKDAFLNTDLDMQSSELTVRQKQNALQDAKDKLADYFIRAPFSGSVTKINVKKTDGVNSGTVITTLITKNQIAEISLNEVDVARVKNGQKADLTFDAIPDLKINGTVVDIDTVGTVSQGVVTYIVKINFDSQDERIKTAMSVSADITTDMKENILVVPNNAVKSRNGVSYIEMFDTQNPSQTERGIGFISPILPNRIIVEIGLTNDSQSEIISGIKEEDEIVIRTISSSATTQAPAPSLFGGSTPTRSTTGGNRIQVR